jgi:Uma2 family endonuclease
MSSLPRSRDFIDYDTYAEREKTAEVRHEYVAGEIYAMAGASAAHIRITRDLAGAIERRLAPNRCDVFNADMRVRIRRGPQQLGYYPDVVVTCPPVPDHTLELEAPLIIAEVLSPSTARTDKHEKFTNYATLASLRHYVLVSSDAARILHYRRTESGAWGEPEELLGRNAVLRLDALGVEIPLSDIYARVSVA